MAKMKVTLPEQTARPFNPTLFGYMEKAAAELMSAGQTNTAGKYLTTLRRLKTFRKNNDIPLEDLTSTEVKQFENWLLARNLSLNTSSFYLRILKAAYNKALKEGLVPPRPVLFGEVYTGIARTRKRAVDEETVRRLYRLELPDKLQYARDLFLFSFYTRGMAFVDMAGLKKNNLSGDSLTYRRSKTGQCLTMRYEEYIREITERYAPLTIGSNYLLPVLCRNGQAVNYFSALRTYNLRLEKISALLGLNRPLTSYVARHSWASIARRKGIPLAVISEGMGHTSEKTTRIYLDSLDQHILDQASRSVIEEIRTKKIPSLTQRRKMSSCPTL